MSALACSRHLSFRCPEDSKHNMTYRAEFALVGKISSTLTYSARSAPKKLDSPRVIRLDLPVPIKAS
jgi:hypothetical protein